jgi:hypothetical protein
MGWLPVLARLASMGWLPVLARLAALAPRTVNALSHAPGPAAALKLAGGIDRRRDLPRFADKPWCRPDS